MNILNKLKGRWNINSNIQLFIILLVFSITGSLAVFIAKPLLLILGIDYETSNAVVFWTIRIGIVFIVYQVLLVLIGTIFGQYRFFWNFEKKMLLRLGFKRFLN